MDDESRLYAERLQADYGRDAPAPPAAVMVPDVFRYIHVKAFAFLTAGPEE